jgi:hypothetical protein
MKKGYQVKQPPHCLQANLLVFSQAKAEQHHL